MCNGPGVAYNPAVLPEPEPDCPLTSDDNGHVTADPDKDGDVDQIDFSLFQRCYSGENVPANRSCAN